RGASWRLGTPALSGGVCSGGASTEAGWDHGGGDTVNRERILSPENAQDSQMNRLRVAFVVQRYGVEVNGGSEALCRIIAERMARFHDVEVLTTRAVDYVTWEDEYPEGTQTIGGVCVRRFGVDHPRDKKEFDAISARVFGGPHSSADEIAWMKKQGPYS